MLYTNQQLYDTMQVTRQHIAIWGNGSVGQSVARFAQNNNAEVTIFDCNIIQNWYDQQQKIWLAPESHLYTSSYTYLIPSPGINIGAYPKLHAHSITEYDLFSYHTKAPHIGITGSLGKTTITSALTNALRSAGVSAQLGGNIGIPMFDLIEQENIDYHVLELSSFQLEYIQRAAPDVAIITNFHPNHLDRHETVQAYLQAKCNIFRYQTPEQAALLPISLRNTYHEIHPNRACFVFADSITEYKTYQHILHPHDTIYIREHNYIYKNSTLHTALSHVPKDISFPVNWLIITAVCDILGYTVPTHAIPDKQHTEQRKEFIGKHQDIYWYNDSKATIMAATCAAVESAAPQPTILILGGLSKGVDRSTYIPQLASNIKHIICFGHEAQQLSAACNQNHIPTTTCTYLSDAILQAYHIASSGDVILFSPGGASFDQFSSYQERGRTFKHIARTYMYARNQSIT